VWQGRLTSVDGDALGWQAAEGGDISSRRTRPISVNNPHAIMALQGRPRWVGSILTPNCSQI